MTSMRRLHRGLDQWNWWRRTFCLLTWVKKQWNVVLFSCLIQLTGISKESKCQLLNSCFMWRFFVLFCILFDTAVEELDVYNFNEDSSEALSPEQPASHESQGSASSPVEARLPEPSSVSPPTGSKLQVSILMVPRFTSRLITSADILSSNIYS